jgi:hypothetical protein
VKIFLVGVGKRAERQIPIVGVGAVEREVIVLFRGGFEQGRVLESVAQAKGAVVMEVVAQELVGGEACSMTALRAGCGSSAAITAVHPS